MPIRKPKWIGRFFDRSNPTYLDKRRRFFRHLIDFLFELIVVVPILGIAVLAIDDVQPVRIFEFVAFSLATISLEICISCILHARSVMTKLNDLKSLAWQNDHRSWVDKINQKLFRMRTQVDLFTLVTIITILSWLYIANVEVKGLAGKDKAVAAADVQKSNEPAKPPNEANTNDGANVNKDGGQQDWHVYRILALASFNFTLAIAKLLVRAFEHDDTCIIFDLAAQGARLSEVQQ
jgi:hypothetical protein